MKHGDVIRTSLFVDFIVIVYCCFVVVLLYDSYVVVTVPCSSELIRGNNVADRFHVVVKICDFEAYACCMIQSNHCSLLPILLLLSQYKLSRESVVGCENLSDL